MKPTSAAPERILAFGSFGSGKTKGYTDIAQMYRTTGTAGTFHIISTEGQIARVRDNYPTTDTDPGWDTNITVYEVTDWLSLQASTTKMLEAVGPEDWVVIDELGKPWEWVRNYYDETRPGYRPMGSGTDPFAVDVEPTRNWDSIKKVYYSWVNSITLNTPWHVYACAHEEPLRVEGGWKDSDEAINTYKYIGVRAGTEKNAPYALYSILWVRRTGAQKWSVTTVKDPSREYLSDAQVVSFPVTYLLGPAGWEL